SSHTLPVLLPQIEQSPQEHAVLYRRQGIIPLPRLFSQRIQTDDILLIVPASQLILPVDLPGMFRCLSCDHSQDIILDPVFFQKADILTDSVIGRLSRAVAPEAVMDLFRPVHGDSDEKSSLAEQPAPLFIE